MHLLYITELRFYIRVIFDAYDNPTKGELMQILDEDVSY